MITNADIKKLKQVFPTKDDLKGFATKDDLKEMEQRMTKTIRSSNLSNVNREVNASQ